jgi:hypothetical protein
MHLDLCLSPPTLGAIPREMINERFTRGPSREEAQRVPVLITVDQFTNGS